MRRAPRAGLRRSLTAAIATTVGVSLLLPAGATAATRFPDVPSSSPHAEAVEDLAAREVVRGKADGTFGPGDLLTRAQLASMIARAEGLAPVADGPFTDVSGPHAGAINALAQRRIIAGKGDGRFDPNGTIKRDQVASMIARYLELDEVAEPAFDDVPAGNVHAGNVNALARIDVARGSEDGRYLPRNDLRRDQAASFLSRGLAHRDRFPDPACPDLDAPVPATATGDEVDGFTPTITVSDTAGLVEGDTVTVTGSGFDPEANVGTRPPLAGQPAGVYIAFGSLADEWRPSEGALPNTRAGGSTRWALPSEATPVPAFNEQQQAERVELRSDGTFVAELTIEAPTAAPGGDDGYSIYTYAGSGAVNATHELEVPVDFRGVALEDVEAEIAWGVKTSFRNYITGSIAGGSIATTGAVTQGRDGVFTWTATVYEQPETDVARSTDGRVAFTGHDGLLHVQLSDLQVVVGDLEEGGLLVADVCSRSLDSAEYVGYPDVTLAELSFVSTSGTDGIVEHVFDATLTDEGVPAFADFYEEGEQLDRITVRVAGGERAF